jgi:hypothetical protein|tara:strand:- start:2538 stop:2651 length:114 start_codon:yes stop_codon:yes gene_type:complete
MKINGLKLKHDGGGSGFSHIDPLFHPPKNCKGIGNIL